MNYYNVEQNSQEWFDLKRGKFTASMFADLFAKDTTQTYWNAIYKVVYERLSGETPETYSNQWMQRGLELEPIAKEWYELETFNKVNNGGFFELSDWIGCSPDGLIDDDGIIEIKCPAYNTQIGYLLDKQLPKIYEWQVCGQLYITDRIWCDFVSYHPKLPAFVLRVNRDKIKESELILKLNQATDIAEKIINKLKGK